jgi:hypothetical protein
MVHADLGQADLAGIGEPPRIGRVGLRQLRVAVARSVAPPPGRRLAFCRCRSRLFGLRGAFLDQQRDSKYAYYQEQYIFDVSIILNVSKM